MIGNDMNKQTILITGINGYLGSHLAKALIERYNIVGLEINCQNLFRLKGLDLKVYEANKEAIYNLFNENKINGIIHTATFYGRQNESVKTLAEANLFIPFEILDNAIQNNCNFFINTDTVLDRFVNTYALTKRHFQEWLYLRRNEIKVVNLQLEHFFGPACSNTNFITSMIERLKRNEEVINLTLGEQQRNFVYIDDVVAAFIKIVERLPMVTENYNSYQVATNELISVKEMMEYLKENTKSSTKLNFGAIPYRENELMVSHIENKALLELGWIPQYSIKEGLLKTIQE